LLAAIPGISKPQADALVHAGLTRIEDLLSADESDISDLPQIGDQAGVVLKAAHDEAAHRKISLDGSSNGDGAPAQP
jgi:predicted RecB family nuclease